MSRRTTHKPPPGELSLENYQNDHLCPVCGEFGAYGHSEPEARIDNIKWYCADHRPVNTNRQQIGAAA